MWREVQSKYYKMPIAVPKEIISTLIPSPDWNDIFEEAQQEMAVKFPILGVTRRDEKHTRIDVQLDNIRIDSLPRLTLQYTCMTCESPTLYSLPVGGTWMNPNIYTDASLR